MSQAQQVQYFLLVSILPTVLFILLVALAAVLGIARWRGAILALALVALLLWILGFFVFNALNQNTNVGGLTSSYTLLQWLAAPSIFVSSVVGDVGAILALIVSARSRAWGWFVVLIIATLVSAVARQFAFSIYPLFMFVGNQRATEISHMMSYMIVVSVLACLTILAQLLYALFGARTPAANVATSSMSDDVTLP